jgi:Right handed beta helix region/Pel9A-like, right handed beta helix region
MALGSSVVPGRPLSESGDPVQGSNLVINPIPKYYLPLIFQWLTGYFVSPSGSDSNPGTFLRPWKTIGKAASMVKPGDNVYIRGGVYQESVEFATSGTASAPIHIMAYPGESPIIDGANFTLPRIDGDALLVLSGNYIYVSGLEVRYSSYLGVELGGNYVTADRINANRNLHSGMRIHGDYDVIQNSHVWSNDMQNENGKDPGADSTAITAARNPNFAIIRHNAIYANWGIGLSTYEANGTTIEDNSIYDNYGPNLYVSDATNVVVQRNFIFATGGMLNKGDQVGIHVEDEVLVPPNSSENITIINNIVYGTERNLACFKGSSGRMKNVLIANNTFINSIQETGVNISDGLSFVNVQFVNNLVQQDGNLEIIMLPNNHPGLTLSNNLWSKTPPQAAISGTDVFGNPLLAQGGSHFVPEYYKLTSQSPAINKAVALPQVTVDFFEIPRGASPDIGANEYISPP